MYFDDLSPYRYIPGIVADKVLNVGWLDDLHSYTKGVVPYSIVIKLNQMLTDKRVVNVMRGVHPCPFCGSHRVYVQTANGQRLLGSSEIWIPAPKGIIFAAPSLIYHYITEHQYRPPQQFLDALEAFDITSDWDGEKALDELIIRQSSQG